MKVINTFPFPFPFPFLLMFSLSITSLVSANQTYKYSIANRLTCLETISNIKERFGNTLIKPVYPSYIKYLKGRDMEVIVTILSKDVSKAQKLLSSSSKLLKASQEISRGCPKIGMVEFVIDGIDDNATYGIVNGRMKEFTCATTPPIKWGENICT